MVKNKTGGNKAKKYGNKYTVSNNKTRFPDEEEEKISIVTKMLGNNIVMVKREDNVECLCHIRKKFSGKNRHNNFISVGTWILVGERPWETNKEKIHTDLLEVYSDKDVNLLKNKYELNIILQEEKILSNIDIEETSENNIIFTNEEEDDENIDIDLSDI